MLVKSGKLFLIFCLISFLAAGEPLHAEEEPDYGVLFYPTAAHWDESQNEWVLPVHGYVYKTKNFSPIHLVGAWLARVYAWFERREDFREIEQNEIDPDDPEAIADINLMAERAKPFFLHGKKNHQMWLFFKGETWKLPLSNKHGGIHTTIRLSNLEPPDKLKAPKSIVYELHDKVSKTVRRGSAYLVPPVGLSVVSDVDDTIKHSEVLDREELFENTMIYPFYDVAGMAAWYREFEKCGAAFHYVSKSPWQLYRPLSDFLMAEDFPLGSFHLRVQQPIGLTALGKVKGPSKKEYIRDLLKRFPGRQFILIGDSTQKDAAIYSELADEFRGQVRHIFIRKVKRGKTYVTKPLEALKQTPENLRTVFTEPTELAPVVCP